MRTVIMLLMLCASMVSAQETAVDAQDDGAAPERRYTVEVIIFSYAEDVSTGTEIFVPDEPPPGEAFPYGENADADLMYPEDDVAQYGDMIVDDPADTETPADESPTWIAVPDPAQPMQPGDVSRAAAATDDIDPDNPYQLMMLAEDEFALIGIADRLELLDAYEPLMHFGWTQPAFPEEETPPIELSLFGELPAGLEGTLTLYLSRYLHLVVDLSLEQQREQDEYGMDNDSVDYYGDDRAGYEDYYERRVMPVRFRIQEDRIMKNEELRYFDHPKYGVVARVVRVEEPEDEIDDEALVLGTAQ